MDGKWNERIDCKCRNMEILLIENDQRIKKMKKKISIIRGEGEKQYDLQYRVNNTKRKAVVRMKSEKEYRKAGQ